MQVTTIGLDIAKTVFQVHGIDAAEKVVVQRFAKRQIPLAPRAPSIHGPSRQFVRRSGMSGVGGQAEVAVRVRSDANDIADI